jgi:nucleotide-binding universal stress UspA family protein
VPVGSAVNVGNSDESAAEDGYEVRGSEIVVGIDGGRPGQAALRWAAKLARATQSRLRVVCVLEWPVGFILGSSPGPGSTLHVPNSAVDSSYLHGMVRVFDEVDPLPGWLFHFAAGNPGEILVQLADQSDLLVIGSREHATAGRALSGGTGHHCLNHSTCPFVTVPVEYLVKA